MHVFTVTNTAVKKNDDHENSLALTQKLLNFKKLQMSYLINSSFHVINAVASHIKSNIGILKARKVSVRGLVSFDVMLRERLKTFHTN